MLTQICNSVLLEWVLDVLLFALYQLHDIKASALPIICMLYVFMFSVGEIVSDILQVPEKCKYLYKESMDMCVSQQQWYGVAKEVRWQSPAPHTDTNYIMRNNA